MQSANTHTFVFVNPVCRSKLFSILREEMVESIRNMKRTIWALTADPSYYETPSPMLSTMPVQRNNNNDM